MTLLVNTGVCVCVFVYIIRCVLWVMYSCASVDAGRFLERGRDRGYSNPHRSHSQIDKCPIKDWWRPQWRAAVWGGTTHILWGQAAQELYFNTLVVTVLQVLLHESHYMHSGAESIHWYHSCKHACTYARTHTHTHACTHTHARMHTHTHTPLCFSVFGHFLTISNYTVKP